MEREKAELIAKNYLNNEDIKTLIVTSDNGVFIDNEVEAMRKHCLENKLEMVVLKGLEAGPQNKPLEVEETPEVEEKQKRTYNKK